MTSAMRSPRDDARAPWSREELERRLRAVGAARYHNNHPFNQRMHRGELSRAELQLWVANRYCYQQAIPLKDAAILSNCPEQAVRRAWIQRIIDHDGRQGSEGGLEAWLRLAAAMGVAREVVLSEAWVLPGVRFAVDAYVQFCRKRPWLEAVAASLTELFAPTIVNERLSAILTHYKWIEPEGLQYFRNRLTQAPRDAEYALGLVLERCVTREWQDRAIGALNFKCDVLWSLLDAVERGKIPGGSP
jgi:pyrroloquinoline-quinone synthase